MFNLLPVTKIISTIAGVYALAVVLVCISLFGWDQSIRLSAVMSGAALLEFLILGFCYVGWRRLWQTWPKLNDWLYPDLNGRWIARIHWVNEVQGKTGTAAGIVHIKQDFLRTSIEMDAERSTSHTISVSVKKDAESGRPLLHYIYEVQEKHVEAGNNDTYRGAASLKVDILSRNELQGNYFTSRGTGGHFEFTRVT